MRVVRAAAFCALLSPVALLAQSSGNWMQFATSPDGADLAINLDRIQRDPYGLDTYSTWLRSSSAKQRLVSGRPYNYSLAQYRVGCSSQTVQTLQILFYDKKGNVVLSSSVPDRVTAAAPDSIGEQLVVEVCALAGIAKK